MPDKFQDRLDKYAELIVKVGLNLQPGQRLLIGNPLQQGVVLDAAPLVRAVTRQAYLAGAKFVEVMWSDEQVKLSRFQLAPADSFEEHSSWIYDGLLKAAQRSDALLTIVADDPDLLSSQAPEKVNTGLQVHYRMARAYMDYISTSATNWCVVGASASAWGKKIFADASQADIEDRLWEAIFQVCRVDQPDPVSAWREHIAKLAGWSKTLNHKRYQALHFLAPGTDLTIGLPAGHRWLSGSMNSLSGIPFVANLPTEEVFTLPHREQVNGVVHSTKPLNHGGVLIEDFDLVFEGGQVVKASAAKNEVLLRKLVETDEGARRLGEVALVPYSSPISQSGLFFYSTLFDENAASHLALGRAYRFSIENGSEHTDEGFKAAGGNLSLIHIDFMIGAADMDIDGIRANGETEPVMRKGEWAF